MQCPKCNFIWFQKQRSNQQNRYFRGVIVPMVAEEIGERDHDHVAEYLKNLDEVASLLREYYPVGNGKGYRVRSTTELDTKQWEEFMSILREWASKFLGVYIPEPNEREVEA